MMFQEKASFQNFLAFKQFCQTNRKYLLLLRTLEMDVMDTCSEGDGVRDLGEEEDLSVSPPPGQVTPPSGHTASRSDDTYHTSCCSDTSQSTVAWAVGEGGRK